jgi:hypothetical protein
MKIRSYAWQGRKVSASLTSIASSVCAEFRRRAPTSTPVGARQGPSTHRHEVAKTLEKGADVPGRSAPDVRRERAVWPQERLGTGQFEPLGLYAQACGQSKWISCRFEERDGPVALGVLQAGVIRRLHEPATCKPPIPASLCQRRRLSRRARAYEDAASQLVEEHIAECGNARSRFCRSRAQPRLNSDRQLK